MEKYTEEQQRREFREILVDLAKEQDLSNTNLLRGMYHRLEHLYFSPNEENEFIHYYSDIFSLLVQIKDGQVDGDIEILGQNLSYIKEHYEENLNSFTSNNAINVSKMINKLYDHVNLDISRLLYFEAAERRMSGDKFDSRMSGIEATLKQMMLRVESTKKKMTDQQKEYVSILGIFAAVVVAFTGGMTFSSSVLDNIANASGYRIIIVTLICGIVLINGLFGLFFYIDKIVEGTDNVKPLFISNAILLTLLVVAVVSWAFGAEEARNKRINSEYMIEQQLMEEVNQYDKCAEEK